MNQFSKPKAEPIEAGAPAPEGRGSVPLEFPPGAAAALPRLIALVMDNLFRLPGTTRRFGLNPFFDLLPIFGDGTAAVISALTLFVAARLRVPKVVMARMSLNILLNAAAGMVPVFGEVFAFWFRPSMRNYELLQKHLAEDGGKRAASTRADWIFVLVVAGGVLLVFAGCIALGAYLFYALLRAVFGR